MRFRRQYTKGLLPQYFILHVTLILMTVVLSAGLLITASMRSITNAEIATKTDAFKMMTREYERQTKYMHESAQRIFLENIYHPTTIKQSKYRDIELLSHFSQFASASPLTEKVFLMYPDTELIYHASNCASYYSYYFAAEYGLDSEESTALYKAIDKTSKEDVIDLEEFGSSGNLFFIYPISFLTSDRYVTAHMIFEVKKATLRMILDEAVGRAVLDSYRLVIDGQMIFEVGEMPSSVIEGVANVFSGVSVFAVNRGTYMLVEEVDGSRVIFEGTFTLQVFRDAIRDNKQWMVIGIIVLIFVLLSMAYHSAWRSTKKIRSLAMQYADPDEIVPYNELYQIENAIIKLEKQHNNIIERAREQMLLQLFRGDATKRMLNRWEGIGITLPYRYSAAYVINCDGVDEKQRTSLIDAINAYVGEEAKLYSICLTECGIVAILMNFEMLDTVEELEVYLKALASAYPRSAICGGKAYTSLFKLPISLDEAIMKLSSGDQQINGVKDQLGQRIETFSEQLYFEQWKEAVGTLREIADLVEQNEGAYYHHEYTRQKLLEEMRHFALANPEFGWDKRMRDIVLLHDFYAFIAEMTDYIMSFPSMKEKDSGNVDERTRQLLQIIEERLDDCDLSLDILADACSLSRGYVSSLIKMATGTPFKEYLTNQRIRRAMKLLIEQPKTSVQDISVQCGYRTFTNFLRKFKEVTDLTPLQYRDHALTEHMEDIPSDTL